MHFTSRGDLLRHEQDKKHKNVVIGRPQLIRCIVCCIELGPTGAIGYVEHAKGRKHRTNLEGKFPQDPGPEEGSVPSRARKCDVCDAVIPISHWTRHINGPRHLHRVQHLSIKTSWEDAQRNKNGIIIDHTSGIDFGIIEHSDDKRASLDLTVKLENSNTYPMILFNTKLTSSTVQDRQEKPHFLVHDLADQGRSIGSGRCLRFPVVFVYGGLDGRYEYRLEFHFKDDVLKESFVITRPVLARVGNKADYELLKPNAPYVRPKRQPKSPVKIEDSTKGVTPAPLKEVPWATRLDRFLIPQDLIDVAYGDGMNKEIIERLKQTFFRTEITKDTYGRYQQVLLWIEEERARRDLSTYDMEDVMLNPVPQQPFYELFVAGLAEKRPSITVSDTIFVRKFSASNERWHEGRVHKILDSKIYLQFHESFNNLAGQRYSVRFELNRTTYRRMHHALSSVFRPGKLLFPLPTDTEPLRTPTLAQLEALRPFDRKITNNPPQRLAVAAALHRPAGSVPLVFFGPPGTGKTVTLVESIRQVMNELPNARILACAPSNSASDLLAEHLYDVDKNVLFRLNAPTRSATHVSTKIKGLSQMAGEVFTVPPLVQLAKYRIVVSTCFSAAIAGPAGIGLQRGHFTHVFIDEAGQATEPEIMIPLKGLTDMKTIVVLAGDVKQLGPIVRSPIARELGLSRSYLDRLLGYEAYDEVTGSGKTIVKLTKNWRSHPSLLHFPNTEFYKNELEPCADRLITHSLLRWDKLVQPGFPIIFHAIAGKDEREALSPSFFNIDEGSLVKKYVKELFGDRRIKLTQQHIGIIAPYNAQVGKIRKVLGKEYKDIKVAVTEEFQGQERRVMILSAVRSDMDFVSFDIRHGLGFVANPRRFNVAITRAQALLIVVGNPHILGLDPLWKRFISYIHRNGGYTGLRLPWDPSHATAPSRQEQQARTDLQKLIERTRRIVLKEEDDTFDRDEDEELEANVDQPWRGEE